MLLLDDAQLYIKHKGMDNGATVFIHKFAGLMTGWWSFLRAVLCI